MTLTFSKAITIFSTIHVTTAARFMEIPEGKNHPLESLTPRTVGDFHNRMMESVDRRMRNNLPTDYESFNTIVEEEMIKAACLIDDDECHEYARKTLKESDKRVRTNYGDYDSLADIDMYTLLPLELNDNIKQYYFLVHEELATLNDGESIEENVDSVVSSIQRIIDNVQDDDDLDMGSKMAITSAASVAIGSTKYWTNFRNDDHNSFRRLQEKSAEYIESKMEQNRETEGIFARLVDTYEVVMSDFIGAVVGSIDPLIDFIFAFGVASPTPILFGSFFTSVADSISATGIVIPAASLIVRCFLEDLLISSINCSVQELFCGDTDFC